VRGQPRDPEYFAFLDSLRRRGVTSMYLAIPRLVREHHLSKSEARAIFTRWCAHYAVAHSDDPLLGREPPPHRSIIAHGIDALAAAGRGIERARGAARHLLATAASLLVHLREAGSRKRRA
jgi:hypothetical protein